MRPLVIKRILITESVHFKVSVPAYDYRDMASAEPTESTAKTVNSLTSCITAPATQLPLPLTPYGTGHFRLLRFLESGHPVWEAAPFDPDASSDVSDESLLPKPSPDLRQFAEAFSLAVDTAQRLRSIINPACNQGHEGQTSYNPTPWMEAVAHRDSARSWLASLLVMIDLLLGTLSQPSKSPFLVLTSARHETEYIPIRASTIETRDSKMEGNSSSSAATSHSMQRILVKHKELCIGMAARFQCLNPLINICTEMHSQLHYSLLLHKDFLTILRELRPYWKLLRRRYTATDFTQNAGNYPYLAEIVIKFFSLPAMGWEIVDSIFLTWPPYPACSPFRGQYAHLRFGTSNASLAGRGNNVPRLQVERPIVRATRVIVNFEGSPAHFIEKKYQLIVSIHPIDLQIMSSNTHSNCMGVFKHSATVIPETITHPIARRVHLQLKAAQLSLMDRATFCVLSSHAQRLSSSVGELDLGSDELFGDNDLLNRFSNESNDRKAVNVNPISSFPAESVFCIQNDCSGLTFLVKGIKPIKLESNNINSSSSDWAPRSNIPVSFPIDVVVRLEFSSSKNTSCVSSAASSIAAFSEKMVFGNPQDSYAIDNNFQNSFAHSKVCGAVSESVLSSLEALALFKLRDMFLDAWKFRSVVLPKQCFDIHSAVFISSIPVNPGGTILQRFLRWIVPYFQDLAFIPG